MLKIKLARFGKRNQPHYRIVINEAKDKRDGSYVAKIGRYVPTLTPKILEIDTDQYDAWVKKGAQPTETVASLYLKFKSGNPFPAKKKKPSKKSVAKSQAKAEEKVAEVAPTDNAPEEETKAVSEEAVVTETEAKEEKAEEVVPAEKTE